MRGKRLGHPLACRSHQVTRSRAAGQNWRHSRGQGHGKIVDSQAGDGLDVAQPQTSRQTAVENLFRYASVGEERFRRRDAFPTSAAQNGQPFPRRPRLRGKEIDSGMTRGLMISAVQRVPCVDGSRMRGPPHLRRRDVRLERKVQGFKLINKINAANRTKGSMTASWLTILVRSNRGAILVIAALTGALNLGAAFAADPTPSFWDPHHRIEKPDLSGVRLLRFVTEDDYPPFDFLAPDGSLTGFNVDLARAVCDALSVACTIQARRWDTIVDALVNGQADAGAASLVNTPDNRKRLDFTAPYYRTPARFVTRRQSALPDPTPENLVGQMIGVQAHTAHEAYLRAFYPRSDIRSYETAASLLSALKRNEVGIIFGDGISLASWLSGADSDGCCAFKGGPFTESRYFGEGVGLAVRKGNERLRSALDYALTKLNEDGTYSELYLKYFPIGFY